MIKCHPLSHFDENDWEEVEQAFQERKPLTFGQHWLTEQQADFSPAQVYIGWRDDDFYALATLHDADIFTEATADGQEMWALGDVFEIFLRALPGDSWYEFHVTPNDDHLELRWPNNPEISRLEVKEKGLGAFIMKGRSFSSHTRTCCDSQHWQVLVKIPAALIADKKSISDGDAWLVSFCRYDYWRDERSPVLSSTAPLTVADFWRQQEWQQMTFMK